MTAPVRCARFLGVGALGMAVQLTTVAVLNRCLPGHILPVTAAALELTLLHNFAWHLHVTWRDRRDPASQETSVARQLLRFHLSTGLVSFAGNLTLMRLLTQGVHMPVLLANLIAIAACSSANFTLANLWTFAHPRTPNRSTLAAPTLGLAALLTIACSTMQAQIQPQPQDLPSAPAIPSKTPASQAKFLPVQDIYTVGLFCGIGASTSSAATKPTTGCGVGLTLVPSPLYFEFGVMAPQANRSYLTGYVTVDGLIPLAPGRHNHLPIAILGYSRLFETGHALDYGLALAVPRLHNPDATKSLRLELRDYWTFANPAQHNIMLRIGWMLEESD